MEEVPPLPNLVNRDGSLGAAMSSQDRFKPTYVAPEWSNDSLLGFWEVKHAVDLLSTEEYAVAARAYNLDVMKFHGSGDAGKICCPGMSWVFEQNDMPVEYGSRRDLFRARAIPTKKTRVVRTLNGREAELPYSTISLYNIGHVLYIPPDMRDGDDFVEEVREAGAMIVTGGGYGTGATRDVVELNWFSRAFLILPKTPEGIEAMNKNVFDNFIFYVKEKIKKAPPATIVPLGLVWNGLPLMYPIGKNSLPAASVHPAIRFWIENVCRVGMVYPIPYSFQQGVHAGQNVFTWMETLLLLANLNAKGFSPSAQFRLNLETGEVSEPYLDMPRKAK